MFYKMKGQVRGSYDNAGGIQVFPYPLGFRLSMFLLKRTFYRYIALVAFFSNTLTTDFLPTSTFTRLFNCNIMAEGFRFIHLAFRFN